jgi:hypothetical protein
MAEYKGFFWNFVFANLIFWLGGLGILITRIAKGQWKNQLWTYIPIFWLPILCSWPVGIAALFGYFD